MAERSQHSTELESSNEEKFYRMLEEYAQQVRLRYHIPVRLNLPRLSSKGSKTREGSYDEK